METETLAKYGTPEWKPISQTRKAKIRPKFEVDCSGCGFGVIGLVNTIEEAEQISAQHDAEHATTLAECCMHARSPACECGNVLV